MLARRVIAISSDKELAKRLEVGLKAAGGAVEVYPSLDALGKGELQAALVVLHMDGDNKGVLADAIARLKKDASIIVVLPRSNLVDAVSSMQSSDRVSGMMVADELQIAPLAAMATRVLYGDIFGLEKVVPWGTRVYSMLVGDYQEKSVCIAQISEFAASMNVRRKYRESIEQVLDEMLMNALYDAPVDAEGKQMFADVPTKTRISLRMEQKAVVQYSCDGDTFTLSVRDSFGTLDRETVLRYLHKCLHSEQQIDRKTGGAGLGLYIMANATTLFFFNVLPGVATEALCTFDLTAPKVQLKRFGFFTEKIDPAGRLVGGPSKLMPTGVAHPVERREPGPPPPPASRAVMVALGALLLMVVALIALVAYPRFKESRAATGTLAVTSQPAGATIEVDGSERGSAPIQLKLPSGRSYKLTATKAGFLPATKVVSAGDGTTAVDFELAAAAATVVLKSSPAGATVLRGGEKIGVTPFKTDDLPPGTSVELILRRVGFADQPVTIDVPAGGGNYTETVALAPDPRWGSVQLTTDPPGATVFLNGTLQAEATPIDEHPVAAGEKLTFTFKKPGFRPATVTVTVPAGGRAVPVAAKLEPGGGLTITADGLRGAFVTVVNGPPRCRSAELPLRDCPLADGTYLVRINGDRPYFRHEQNVTVKGDDQTIDLPVGIINAADGWTIQVRRDRKVTKWALLAGAERVTVVEEATQATRTIPIVVQAGKTYTLP
jgi:hypothetical protein